MEGTKKRPEWERHRRVGGTLRDEAGGASKAQLTLGLGGQGEDLCLVLRAMKSYQKYL